MENVFFDIGLIIIIATLLGYLARLIKQPLIPGYILAGIIIGPELLGLVTDRALINTFAEIGIAFLLFTVGLELDFSRLKSISAVGSIGGVIKTTALFALGFILALLAGLTGQEAIYVALVLALTSTMVVIKLLSDKRELDTLHGRIALGMLVVEDLIGIIFLVILSPTGVHFSLFTLIRGVIALAALYFLSRVIFPKLFQFGATFTELLTILSLSVCFLFAMISDSFGLSIAIGAYLGGVSLANLPWNIEISSRIKPLRDFFSVLFFATLGMELSFTGLASALPLFGLLLVFILVVRPFVILFIVRAFGYTAKTCFLTAISLTTVDEFSLILVTGGFLAGKLSQPVFAAIILLTVVSIISSSYIMEFSRQLTALFRKTLDRMPAMGVEHELIDEKGHYSALLIGYDRTAYSIVKKLRTLKKSFLVIDYNPEVIRRLSSEGVHCIYGDISDAEVLDRIDFKHVEIVISTAPEMKDNLLLLRRVKELNKSTSIFVTAYGLEDALELYDAGADYVILPHFIGGDHVAVLLEEITPNINKLLDHKIRHIEELRLRHHLGHDHLT